MTLIDIKGIGYAPEKRTVLENVSFSIPAGKIITLIGPNGAGKTTLLKIILGIVEPTSGTIERAEGLKIGYVPQKLHLSRTIPVTAGRFLTLGPGKSEDVRSALAETGAEDLIDRDLSQLSGGETQRVLLARALIGNPDLLVLDEPDQGLDPVGEETLYRTIEELNKRRGCAVLTVSHDLHVVMARTDLVVCLNRHICCSGKPQEIAPLSDYTTLYRHHHDHKHLPDGSIADV